MNREFIEDIILEMADIVQENRILREENFELKMKIKENNDRLDREYRESTKQVANIFNTVLKKLP